MYDKILKWYKQSLWTEQMVLNAFLKNVITEDQYHTILVSKEG